ncbi:MAG: hypothetical protein MUO89_02045 [Dehalococcoidia bacterium]|nr:hypothetical protein [Dehalococcoidia bacterium]
MKNNSESTKIRERVTIITLILGLLVSIGSLIFIIISTTTRPDLTYDCGRHYLLGQMGLATVVLQNQGGPSAEDVEINATASGNIQNISVTKQVIGSESANFPLFKDSTSINIDESSATIKIPYIAVGVRYVVDLILETKNPIAINGILITSKNGGVARNYFEERPLVLLPFILGFVFGGIFAGASISLYRVLKRRRCK